MDQTNLNMQLAVAAKTAAEGKAGQLAEQKKVLIKEVKQSRKKMEELSDTIAALKATIVAQQAQLAMFGSRPDTVSASPHPIVTPVAREQGLDSDDEDEGLSNHVTQTHVSSPPAISVSSSTAPSASVSHRPSVSDPANNVEVAEHEALHPQTPVQQTAQSSYFSSMFGGTTTHVRRNSRPLLSADDDLFRPSNELEDPGQSTATDGSHASPQLEAHSSPSNDSAFKIRCLRCNGTVEGPKFSTCTCAVPALCPEDLQSDFSSESAVGSLFKATGSLMSNIGRRASILGGGGGSSNNNSSASEGIAAPAASTRRSSLAMFGFGSSDK